MNPQLSIWPGLCGRNQSFLHERVFSLTCLRLALRHVSAFQITHSAGGDIKVPNGVVWELKVRVAMPHVVCVPSVVDRLRESREVRAGSFFGLRR